MATAVSFHAHPDPPDRPRWTRRLGCSRIDEQSFFPLMPDEAFGAEWNIRTRHRPPEREIELQGLPL